MILSPERSRIELLKTPDIEFVGEWLRCVAADSNASIFLHPDLSPDLGKIRILAGWEKNQGTARKLTSIGVLAEKTIRVRLAPGFRAGMTLRGHRVVGNQVGGATTSNEIAPTIEAMFDAIEACQLGCVLIEDVEVDSPLHSAITRGAATRRRICIHHPAQSQAHWWIDFSDRPEDYWKKFSKKTRYNLRSAVKRLDHRLVRFDSASSVPQFLELSHRVSKASWQAKRLGVRITNAPEERQMFDRLAKIGALRSYVLEQDDRPIAFAVGFQWGGRFLYEEVGYDLAFAGQSPGTVLLYRLLEDLIADNTPRVLDFGFGDGEYKRVFGTRSTQTGPILIARRTLSNLSLLRASQLVGSTSQRLTSSIRNSVMLRRLRQLYRR